MNTAEDLLGRLKALDTSPLCSNKRKSAEKTKKQLRRTLLAGDTQDSPSYTSAKFGCPLSPTCPSAATKEEMKKRVRQNQKEGVQKRKLTLTRRVLAHQSIVDVHAGRITRDCRNTAAKHKIEPEKGKNERRSKVRRADRHPDTIARLYAHDIPT